MEPTLTDVFEAIAGLQGSLRDLRIDGQATRVAVLEGKADLAALRLTITEQFASIRATLGTLIDEVASFRAEYAAHTHEE